MAVLDLDQLMAQGIRGQSVFLRADLNVPLRDGVISDDSRVRASLRTMRRLIAGGARLIVTSHLGRPKGTRVPELTLRPVAPRLAELLGTGVSFCEDCVGELAEAAVSRLDDGQVLLLENLRFHAGETKNDPDFARALADLADVYVNDAFGTAHRAHASTVGVVAHTPRAAAGDLLKSEINHLRVVLEPERPLLAILGGAKVSGKVEVMEALAPHADVLALGGAMVYTFLARGGQPRRARRPPGRPPPAAADGPRGGRGARAGGPDAGGGDDSRGLDRRRHRAGDRPHLRGGGGPRAHGLLERSAGSLRDRGLRARHRDRGPGRGEDLCDDRGGGRRFGGGRQPARRGRSDHPQGLTLPGLAALDR
jgi:hypothetical protein